MHKPPPPSHQPNYLHSKSYDSHTIHKHITRSKNYAKHISVFFITQWPLLAHGYQMLMAREVLKTGTNLSTYAVMLELLFWLMISQFTFFRILSQSKLCTKASKRFLLSDKCTHHSVYANNSFPRRRCIKYPTKALHTSLQHNTSSEIPCSSFPS